MNGFTEILATVKALQEAFPVVNTLASGMAGGIITHLLARRLDDRKHARERQLLQEKRLQEAQALEEKRKTELQFIAIELIFLLEEFALGCIEAVLDRGKKTYLIPGELSGPYRMLPEVPEPVFDLSVVKGDWKVLPLRLLFLIRWLSVHARQVERVLGSIQNSKPNAMFQSDYFETRQARYTRAGIKALNLSCKLRRLCHLPASNLTDGHDSVLAELRQRWRKYIRIQHRRARAERSA